MSSGLQSIYRKDYLWPVRKFYFPRTDLSCSIASPKQNDPRQFDKDQSACTTSEEAPNAKLGACPKTERLEFSEIDACLKKMFRENPNMFSVTKKRPSTDALSKFNAERLKSTYQVDFDRLEDQAQIEQRQAACPNEATDLPPVCRPQTRSRAELMKRRRGGTSEPQPDPCTEKLKSKKKKKRLDESDQPDFMLRVLPPWSSEYRDVIGKTGTEIMREMKMSPRKRAARLRRKRFSEIPLCEDKMTLS